MWWLTFPIYVIGWMTTFRFLYLRITDARQRWVATTKWYDSYYRNRDIKDRRFKDLWKIWGGAFGWPGTILYALGKRIMFPAGVKTKFDREQEAKKRTEEAEEELRKARKLMDEMGIKHGYR